MISDTLFNSQIDSGKVVAIDLWEESCEPCKIISPVFEEYSNDPKFSGIEFYNVNCTSREGDNIAQETRVSVVSRVSFR